MSVETILRNVYSYLEVLEATHSDVVRHWSEDSLENSLKWAHYCEQIYTQSRGKPYLPKLEEQIQKFNTKPWNLGGTVISLGFFRDAQHHLKYALLQNPYLCAHLYSLVLKSYLNDGPDALVQVCSSLSEPRMVMRIASTIKESRPSSLSDNDLIQGTASETCREVVEASALLFHRYLSHIFRLVPSTPRTDTALRKTMDDMLSQPKGFEIICRCLHHANQKYKDKTATNISYFLTEHAEEFLKKDTSRRCIRSMPMNLLAEVAANDNKVFDAYLYHLVMIGNTIVLKHPHDTANLPSLQRGAPVSTSWTYEELLTHLVALQSAVGPSGRSVHQRVEQLTRTTDSPVWERVTQDLLASQNKVRLG